MRFFKKKNADPNASPPEAGRELPASGGGFRNRLMHRKNSDPDRPRKPLSRGKKRLIRVVAIVLVVAVGGGVAVNHFFGTADAQTASLSYTEDTVQRRDIVNTLSGSGTLEPADSYTVTTLLEAEILSDSFEEGDTVQAGDLLYEIDSSDAANSLEQAENSLSQAQTSYQNTLKELSNLSVTATADGQIADLQVEVGDTVSSGQTVATIRDSSAMTIELYFPADEAAGFYVGQAAQVTLDGSFETLAGTVTEISGLDETLSGNRIVRAVTIQVANPGAISTTTSATATVGTSACTQSGTFAYRTEKAVLAETSGEVVSVSVAEGDTVTAGQVLVTLENDSLTESVENAANSVSNAELSLETQQDKLDDYTITSPIDGTIIEKNYKQGENTEANATLCIIYDLSYLTFTMNVDELDVGLIEEGQTVTITADAVDGETFTGTVTKVSINGTTAGGVTTYPVTVRIDDADDLLPGMNVDAVINVSEQLDVLSVPAAAVSRGDRVLAKSTEGEAPTEEENAPEGYTWVTVTLGESDGSYVEILDGLEEGQEIAYVAANTVDSEDSGMAGAMGGGMPGGMAGGGMGGGMPGGGMGGGPGGF